MSLLEDIITLNKCGIKAYETLGYSLRIINNISHSFFNIRETIRKK